MQKRFHNAPSSGRFLPPYEKVGDARRTALGSKSRVLVPLRGLNIGKILMLRRYRLGAPVSVKKTSATKHLKVFITETTFPIPYAAVFGTF